MSSKIWKHTKDYIEVLLKNFITSMMALIATMITAMTFMLRFHLSFQAFNTCKYELKIYLFYQNPIIGSKIIEFFICIPLNVRFQAVYSTVGGLITGIRKQ